MLFSCYLNNFKIIQYTEFLQEKINEVLEENKFETVTNEVQAEQTTDKNGNVEIVENEEYIEAISGGLSDLYQACELPMTEVTGF